MNPILALIIANIIWGAAPPIFKFALQNIPPFTLAFIRFFFAGIIFLPFSIKYLKNLTKKNLFEIFLVGFFGVFINITFFFLGLKKTESINVPIIASSGPIILYFLSIIFLKEKPRFKIFVSMMISLFGVLLIVLSPLFFNGNKVFFGEFQGNLFIVLATLGSVIQTIVAKNLLKKINPYVVTALSFLISSSLFIFFIPNELRTWSLDMININGLIGIIFGLFFSSAIAYFLYYYGVSLLPGQEVGIFTYIDPVIAVIVAIPLLGEYPDLFYFLGSFLVFGGIFLAEKRIHWHPINKLKIKN